MTKTILERLGIHILLTLEDMILSTGSNEQVILGHLNQLKDMERVVESSSGCWMLQRSCRRMV